MEGEWEINGGIAKTSPGNHPEFGSTWPSTFVAFIWLFHFIPCGDYTAVYDINSLVVDVIGVYQGNQSLTWIDYLFSFGLLVPIDLVYQFQ